MRGVVVVQISAVVEDVKDWDEVFQKGQEIHKKVRTAVKDIRPSLSVVLDIVDALPEKK